MQALNGILGGGLAVGLLLLGWVVPRGSAEEGSAPPERARRAPPGLVRAPGAPPARPASTHAPVASVVPPAPEGVTDLKFSEMFQPIGARGLDYTEKLRRLDGKKVRMLGYMAKQSRPMPWTFLFASVPLTLHETEYGFAEDMPASVVHVVTQRNTLPIVPFTPGPMLLTGTLSVGNREEADGRISTVRLMLDPPTPEQRAALTRLQNSTGATNSNRLPARP